MSVKPIALWVSSISLLAFSAFAWLCCVANGIAYGDTFGVRGEEASLLQLHARCVRCLVLALIAEESGVAIIVWQFLGHHDTTTRIAFAATISLLATGCTLAFVA
jgi:hypothetical protein